MRANHAGEPDPLHVRICIAASNTSQWHGADFLLALACQGNVDRPTSGSWIRWDAVYVHYVHPSHPIVPRNTVAGSIVSYLTVICNTTQPASTSAYRMSTDATDVPMVYQTADDNTSTGGAQHVPCAHPPAKRARGHHRHWVAQQQAAGQLAAHLAAHSRLNVSAAPISPGAAVQGLSYGFGPVSMYPFAQQNITSPHGLLGQGPGLFAPPVVPTLPSPLVPPPALPSVPAAMIALQAELQQCLAQNKILEVKHRDARTRNVDLEKAVAAERLDITRLNEMVARLKRELADAVPAANAAPSPPVAMVQPTAPLQECRWHDSTISPAHAFRVPPGWRTRECVSAGVVGRQGLVPMDLCRTELTEEEEAAVQLTKDTKMRDASFEVNDEARVRTVLYAMDVKKRAHLRKHAETGESVKPFDISEMGRAAANGDFVPSWRVFELIKHSQEELHLLALELADARGWNNLGPTVERVWSPPAPWKTESANKAARRTATRMNALVKRMRELLGGQIGLDNYWAWQMTSELTGNMVWRKFCNISSASALRVVWQNVAARKVMEVERRKVHMHTPSRVNGLRRASHSTQRNMKMTRYLANGQVQGNEILQQAKYRDIKYQGLITPNGKDFEEVVEIDEGADVQAALEEARRAAEQRAADMVKQEELEKEMIKSEAQRDFEILVAPALAKAKAKAAAKKARAAARKAEKEKAARAEGAEEGEEGAEEGEEGAEEGEEHDEMFGGTTPDPADTPAEVQPIPKMNNLQDEARSVEERLAESHGTLNCSDPLGALVNVRGRFNGPMPRRRSGQMVIAVGTDAAEFKHVSFTKRQYNVCSGRAVAFGTRADIVTHQMPQCQSYLRSFVFRLNEGPDHAPQLKEYVCPYIKELCNFKESKEVLSWKPSAKASKPSVKQEKITKLVVQHVLLHAPPEELDQQFNVIKSYPVGTSRHPERMDLRLQCFSDLEVEIEPIFTGDQSMLMHLTQVRHISQPRGEEGGGRREEGGGGRWGMCTAGLRSGAACASPVGGWGIGRDGVVGLGGVTCRGELPAPSPALHPPLR